MAAPPIAVERFRVEHGTSLLGEEASGLWRRIVSEQKRSKSPNLHHHDQCNERSVMAKSFFWHFICSYPIVIIHSIFHCKSSSG